MYCMGVNMTPSRNCIHNCQRGHERSADFCGVMIAWLCTKSTVAAHHPGTVILMCPCQKQLITISATLLSSNTEIIKRITVDPVLIEMCIKDIGSNRVTLCVAEPWMCCVCRLTLSRRRWLSCNESGGERAWWNLGARNAKFSVRSPWKLLFFTIYKTSFLDQSIPKN